MSSTAAGQMVFLPLLSYLTVTYSWRTALTVFVGLGILMIPLIAFLMKDHPSDKGLLPYGAVNKEANKSTTVKKIPLPWLLKV